MSETPWEEHDRITFACLVTAGCCGNSLVLNKSKQAGEEQQSERKECGKKKQRVFTTSHPLQPPHPPQPARLPTAQPDKHVPVLSGLTVLLSLSWKLNGSELTEILEAGITESKHCQITVPSPSRALLRGNEVLDLVAA